MKANADENIEVIAIKNDICKKKIMKLSHWYDLIKNKPKNGFKYKAYQIGFSQYKTEN